MTMGISYPLQKMPRPMFYRETTSLLWPVYSVSWQSMIFFNSKKFNDIQENIRISMLFLLFYKVIKMKKDNCLELIAKIQAS